MSKHTELWIDALDFKNKGGWKEDTQYVHLMGGGYLIAADEPGVPVEDAVVTVNVPAAGHYRVWVRDRNWLRPHNPGQFTVLGISSASSPPTSGCGRSLATWSWRPESTPWPSTI